MEPTSPLYTADLFPPLHEELIRLLRGLSPDDWVRPTVAGEWRVREVVAHLLDIDLRKLSVERDRHRVEPPDPIRSYADLVGFIDGLNAEWVRAAQRLSRRVLVDLHAFTGPLVSELVASLPPHEPATFAVGWAGETESENWFDVGRDYTERWHHQMQIRDAVGAPLLLERKWLYPLMDLSLRALPRAYRGLESPVGTPLTVRLEGIAGDAWSLVREDEGWRLYRGSAAEPAATVTLDPDTAWRILFNALPPEEARTRAVVEGDAALVERLFATRSVMVERPR